MSATSEECIILTPPQSAAMLGVSVHILVELLRLGGYPFTDLSPGGKSKPWGRGRKTWGLTRAQLDAVVAGQARRFPTKATAPAVSSGSVLYPGHDGINRLRRPKPKPEPAG
jgi:hypothetical protein